MEGDVHQVVAEGFEATQPVIELVAQRAHRAVRAVRTGVAQVGAPKVIGEQVEPRCGRQDVCIAQNGTSASDKWEMVITGCSIKKATKPAMERGREEGGGMGWRRRANTELCERWMVNKLCRRRRF